MEGNRKEYRFLAALQWCKKKFSTFKTEERRKVTINFRVIKLMYTHVVKVLGIRPYTAFAEYATAKLARSIIRTMKAPLDVGIESVYTRNLAALVSKNIISQYQQPFLFIKRKFVRTDNSSRRAGELHKNFNEWLETSFPGGRPSEEEYGKTFERTSKV